MIENREHPANCLRRLEPARKACGLAWVLGGLILFGGLKGQAGPVVSTESPIGFFTNVAARLLESQLKLSLNRIQLYPTNQYTPSVHRLLQVTANLYEVLTNRTDTPELHLPFVFRPVFANEAGRAGSQIFISGFEEVTNTSVLSQRMVDLSDANARLDLKSHDMVCGVPLVIGTRKGFPNFNEFALQTQVQIERKLQFARPDTNSPVNQTNQMFIVGITNTFGVEAWNPYSNSFSRNLQISVQPDITAVLTNEVGTQLVNQRYLPPATVTNIPANTWTGDNPAVDAYSFRIPLFTNNVFLSNSTFWKGATPAGDQFIPLTNTFQQVPGRPFYVPHWWLNLKTQLRFALVDTDANRIVDYVNLASTAPSLDLTDALTHDSSQPTGPSPCPTANGSYSYCSNNACMWCTNRGPEVTAENRPTFGIRNQIGVCLGSISAGGGTFMRDFPVGAGVSGDDGAIDFFRIQFPGLTPIYYPPGTFARAIRFNAPFEPYRSIYLFTLWQANDPLVHYTVGDLKNLVQHTKPFELDWPDNPSVTDYLRRVNPRCLPWGINPYSGTANNYPTAYDSTVKDPMAKAIALADDWDFPTNALPDLSWLGRVHRGTPWQTLYLKAPGTSLSNWILWTGNDQLMTNWNGGTGVTQDAFYTQPTNDWRVASLLVSLLTTNDPRHLLSINQTGTPPWLGALDGMVVLTNDVPDDVFQLLGPVHFTSAVMSSNSPQAATIAVAINAMRSSQPNQHFQDAGDILATPELSVASPWLNTSTAAQQCFGLTDAAYETIPSQLLPLLRPDSVGSIAQEGGVLQVQFRGYEGAAYAVQVSSNLVDWTALSTNYITGGVFTFIEVPSPGAPCRFYRSLLLP